MADQVRARLSSFSPSERKVARALLTDYPVAGLQTIAELAARAQVSAPTVLRFTSRLGYASYPDLQRALHREVQVQMGSPLRQLAAGRANEPASESIGAVAEVFASGVRHALAVSVESDISEVVDLLTESRRTVSSIGGRFSRVLATYLSAHLELIRPHVRTVGEGPLERAAAVLDMDRNDIVAVFDYRRYDASVIEFSYRAKARGARVILFTDQWLSAAADVADVVLTSPVQTPSPFDSYVPAMALVETVVALTTARLGPAAEEHLRAMEALQSTPQGGAPGKFAE